MNRISKSVLWFVSSYPPRPNGREFGCATPTLDRWTAQKGQTFHVALWATSHRRVARQLGQQRRYLSVAALGGVLIPHRGLRCRMTKAGHEFGKRGAGRCSQDRSRV